MAEDKLLCSKFHSINMTHFDYAKIQTRTTRKTVILAIIDALISGSILLLLYTMIAGIFYLI